VDITSALERLIANITSYAAGTGFFGGWVLQPTVVAAGILVLRVAQLGLRERHGYALFLLTAILLMPFALSVALGSPLPNRAMQALPLVAASMWLVLSLEWRNRAVSTVLLIGALLFSIWNAGITTRLFMAEQYAFDTDRTIAGNIAERLSGAGWDGRSLAIVIIGDRTLGPIERIASHETFGKSFFNWGEGGRASGFMRVLGYPMQFPSNEQQMIGSALGESMPTWPAKGSVLMEDGIAVVKFSDP
jgi:hypothetical protein